MLEGKRVVFFGRSLEELHETCGIYYLYLGHGWHGWVSFVVTRLPVQLRFVYFSRGAWVGHSFKHPTLDLSLGPEHRLWCLSSEFKSNIGLHAGHGGFLKKICVLFVRTFKKVHIKKWIWRMKKLEYWFLNFNKPKDLDCKNADSPDCHLKFWFSRSDSMNL